MSITSAAKGIMRKIVSIDIGASVSEASKIMTREELGSIVISKNGKPIGIMTERDVLRKVVEPGLNPREVSVGDVMSSPLITVSSETGIAEALRIMSDRNIRRLLVTEDDKIVGIITEMDLIKAIRDSYANLLTAIMEALKPLGKR
jgi:CBS domain-containing protein